MTDNPIPSDSETPAESQRPEHDRRRELELELIRVRSAAEAARLEARAAELELAIRRMSRGEESPVRVDSAHDLLPKGQLQTTDANPTAVASAPAESEQNSQPPAEPTNSTSPGFTSWDAVRSVSPPASSSNSTVDTGEIGATSEFVHRFDSANAGARQPKFLAGEIESKIDESLPEDASLWDTVAPDDTLLDTQSTTDESTNKSLPSAASTLADADQVDRPERAQLKSVAIAEEPDGAEDSKQRSPTALLISAMVHAVILFALGALTLSAHDPKDQVALAASVSDPSEQVMETFQIETTESTAEPTDPTPAESQYDLNPLGDIAVADFAPDAPPAPPAPPNATATVTPLSAAAMSLKSDSEAKIQFCGVEGGGNHFVYLVDSSGSMGDAFESARAELLSSIDVLKPDQRFYVVFFDAEPDFMRLTDPATDEPRSAFATPENKQALRRWAMRVSKNRGRAPYEPLKFALELKPDVIFLLSDGEFPQGIEDLLKENNLYENLFGDTGPISIVHTIGYHSREGETRMRRIAEQNQGQYRHVPKP